MKLLIDAKLTEPPSEISVFRDITLYSTTFLNYDVLLECEEDVKDLYWYWLRNRGAFDYVSDIVKIGSETGITIRQQENADIVLKYLRTEQLQLIINKLRI
tara:strand:- start:2780 stop:3082 length:303 start_codon:yes stop_codon:yes gene_type:complete